MHPHRNSHLRIIGQARDWDIQETRPAKHNRVEFSIHFDLLNFRCWTLNLEVFNQFVENLKHIENGQKIEVEGYLWLFNGHEMRLMVTNIQPKA